MNCFEFRRHRLSGLRAEPAELVSHLGGCPECARFSSAVEELDGKIETAARVDPPGELLERILLDQRLRSRRRFLRFAAAASVAGLAGAGGYAYWRRGVPAAEVALAHVGREPEALRDGPSIPLGRVVEAFASRGGRLQGPLGRVTFLALCPVRGGKAPHVVVETAHGQANLLLLPHRAIGRETVARDRLVAVAMPAGEGSLAIVAGSEQTVAGVERLMAQLVSWS